MTPINIPPAALEAAARAAHNQWRHDCAKADKQPVENWREWEELEEFERQEWIAQTRAAALALLENWPGMHHYNPHAEPYYGKHIILPLPMENEQ